MGHVYTIYINVAIPTVCKYVLVHRACSCMLLLWYAWCAAHSNLLGTPTLNSSMVLGVVVVVVVVVAGVVVVVV